MIHTLHYNGGEPQGIGGPEIDEIAEQLKQILIDTPARIFTSYSQAKEADLAIFKRPIISLSARPEPYKKLSKNRDFAILKPNISPRHTPPNFKQRLMIKPPRW